MGHTTIEEKLLELLDQSHFSYDELQEHLGVEFHILNNIMKEFRRKNLVKHIGKGARHIFYRDEKDKEQAEIEVLGKYALAILEIIGNRDPKLDIYIGNKGPKRSGELSKIMKVGTYKSILKSLDALVAGGYIKRKAGFSDYGGLIYYQEGTPDNELFLKSLGTGQEKVYRILTKMGKPITSDYLAKEIGITVTNVDHMANKLADKGWALMSKKSKFGKLVLYLDSQQNKLAEMITISPKYGEDIYNNLGFEPITTFELVRRIGGSRITISGALNGMQKRGIIEKYKGDPGYPNSWCFISMSESKVKVLEYMVRLHPSEVFDLEKSFDTNVLDGLINLGYIGVRESFGKKLYKANDSGIAFLKEIR